MLLIVTGNANKFARAMEHLTPLGIQAEQKDVSLIEPQENEIVKVAEHKAIQAFGMFNQPVLISDSGWSIPALKGFPGPFMHYIVEWFEIEDFLHLMENKADRSISLENIVVYKDSSTQQIFRNYRSGILLTEPKGEGISVDRLTTFRSDKKTIAECIAQKIPSFDKDTGDSPWLQFGKWYKAEKDN